jgi:DNA-binding CsgD family transcriptional regulator
VFQGRDDLADEHLRAMAARRKTHPSTRLHLDELTRQIVDDAMGRYAAVRKAADLVRQGLESLSEINMQGAALAVAGWVEVERGNALRVIDEMEALLGRPPFGWDSLTSTEQRVAGLLVAGRTNPEIARELLMGRETVKTHVSAILRKLGLANRTQVASAITARSQAAME